VGIASCQRVHIKINFLHQVGGEGQQLTNERGSHSHQEKFSSSNCISSTPTIGLSFLSGQGPILDQLLEHSSYSPKFPTSAIVDMLELRGVTTVLLDIGKLQHRSPYDFVLLVTRMHALHNSSARFLSFSHLLIFLSTTTTQHLLVPVHPGKVYARVYARYSTSQRQLGVASKQGFCLCAHYYLSRPRVLFEGNP
jgi:hypothetical protein